MIVVTFTVVTVQLMKGISFPCLYKWTAGNDALMKEIQADNSSKLQNAPHIHCSTILLMY